MEVDLFNIFFKQIINELDYGILLFSRKQIIFANEASRKILPFKYDDFEKPTIFRIIKDNLPEIANQFELNFLKLFAKEINSFELSNALKQENINKIVNLKVISIEKVQETYFVMEINNSAPPIRELIQKNQSEIDKLNRKLFTSQYSLNTSYNLIEELTKQKKTLQMQISKLEQDITFLEKQLTMKSMEMTLSQTKRE